MVLLSETCYTTEDISTCRHVVRLLEASIYSFSTLDMYVEYIVLYVLLETCRGNVLLQETHDSSTMQESSLA
jgi:hypothetical protein